MADKGQDSFEYAAEEKIRDMQAAEKSIIQQDMSGSVRVDGLIMQSEKVNLINLTTQALTYLTFTFIQVDKKGKVHDDFEDDNFEDLLNGDSEDEGKYFPFPRI